MQWMTPGTGVGAPVPSKAIPPAARANAAAGAVAAAAGGGGGGANLVIGAGPPAGGAGAAAAAGAPLHRNSRVPTLSQFVRAAHDRGDRLRGFVRHDRTAGSPYARMGAYMPGLQLADETHSNKGAGKGIPAPAAAFRLTVNMGPGMPGMPDMRLDANGVHPCGMVDVSEEDADSMMVVLGAQHKGVAFEATTDVVERAGRLVSRVETSWQASQTLPGAWPWMDL